VSPKTVVDHLFNILEGEYFKVRSKLLQRDDVFIAMGQSEGLPVMVFSNWPPKSGRAV